MVIQKIFVINKMKMKNFLATTVAVFLLLTSSFAQQKTENVIIITTDGFRWQEVFGGIDSSIAVNNNQGDSAYIFKKYWANNAEERRKKLLLFYGTRLLQKDKSMATGIWAMT